MLDETPWRYKTSLMFEAIVRTPELIPGQGGLTSDAACRRTWNLSMATAPI
jgi:hypothetical protein